MFGPSVGFTRVNYEMARSLVALNRPREAVAVLQAALRGVMDASNLYVSRTELHELLAESFDRAGMADSAAVHYRAVVKAWRRADPMFHARRDHAAASARSAWARADRFDRAIALIKARSRHFVRRERKGSAEESKLLRTSLRYREMSRDSSLFLFTKMNRTVTSALLGAARRWRRYFASAESSAPAAYKVS